MPGSRMTVPSGCVTATVAYRFSPDEAEPGKNGSTRYRSRLTSKRVPSTYWTTPYSALTQKPAMNAVSARR